MLKDLRLALQLAAAKGQPVPMGEKASQLYQQVISKGRAEESLSTLALLISAATMAGAGAYLVVFGVLCMFEMQQQQHCGKGELHQRQEGS